MNSRQCVAFSTQGKESPNKSNEPFTSFHRLYKRDNSHEWAAHYYERFTQQAVERGIVEGTSAHTEAFLFLARHNLEHNNAYDTAAYYAQKCCEYPEVSEIIHHY